MGSKTSKKRIITASITGSINLPCMSPYLPVTPKDIARNAIDAANAGAASVHIHARVPEGPDYGLPSTEKEYFQEIIDRIRTENKDVIISITTGGGVRMSVEERASVIPMFKPELGSLNAGSINWGVFQVTENPNMKYQYEWEKPYLANTKSYVFKNSFEDLEGMLKIFNENGTKPELECYDVGHIYNVKWMKDQGLLKGKPYIQFCTGILGAAGASPETIMMLKETADRVLGADQYIFSSFGAGKMEFPCVFQSLLIGGHCRVGMEDNLYLSKGVLAKSNAELVEKVVKFMDMMDYPVASPDDAREIIGLEVKSK